MVADESGKARPRANFEEAFGFSGYETTEATESDIRLRGGYDENIRLAPYTYAGDATPAQTSEVGLPRYTAHAESPDLSLPELRRAHVHSPDPAELKRYDYGGDAKM